jgi:hypothetical protein
MPLGTAKFLCKTAGFIEETQLSEENRAAWN